MTPFEDMQSLVDDVIIARERSQTMLDEIEQAISAIGGMDVMITLPNYWNNSLSHLEIVAIGRVSRKKYKFFGPILSETVFYERRDCSQSYINGSRCYSYSTLQAPHTRKALTGVLDKGGHWGSFLINNARLIELIRTAVNKGSARPDGSKVRSYNEYFDNKWGNGQ